MVLREYTIIFHLLDRFISFNINYAFKTNPTYWIFVRALALKNSNSTLFYHSKKPLYHYTIPFYNTSSIPNFYFPILLIKIIYLHNKIIYPQTQIKTKTQITICYHHHHEQPNPPLCSFPFSFHAPDKPYASKII